MNNNKRLHLCLALAGCVLVASGRAVGDNRDYAYPPYPTARTGGERYPQRPPPGPWGGNLPPSPQAAPTQPPGYRPRLPQARSAASEERLRLQQQLQSAREQLQRLKQEADEAASLRDFTIVDLHQCLDSQRALRDQFNTANKKAGELEAKVRKLSAQAEKAQAAEARVAQLESELAKMEELRVELDQLRARLKENASARDRLAELQSELERSTTRVAELEARLAETNAAAPRLAEMKQKLEAAEAAAARVEELQQQLEARTARVSELEKQLAEMKPQLASAENAASRVEELQRQLEAATERVNQLENQLAEAETRARQFAEMKQRLEVAERAALRVRELQQELEAGARRIDELEKRLAEAGTAAQQLAELKQELAAARAATERLASLQHRLEETEKARAQDSAELAQTRKEIAALTSEVAKLRKLQTARQGNVTAAGGDTTVGTVAQAPPSPAGESGAAPVQTEMAALQKQGKSTDGDGDGVPDAADFCPESTGKELVGPTGCTLHIPVVMKGVHFRYDSHELTDDSRQVLDRIARLLRQHPDVRFEIAGHSDAQGDPAYNEWLSQQRAEEVKRYLVAHGVSAEQLTARGYGSRQPLAPNDSREGLLRNRRVELRRLP